MAGARVIPCLDVEGGRVVKGVNFVGLRDAGDPVELARRYVEEGADELVFLDITATTEDRATIVDVAARVAEVVPIPFTVGGGIRSVDDAGRLLDVGVDTVSVGTAAFQDPGVITAIADRFGSGAVTVAIDARGAEGGGWQVCTQGGRNATGRDLVAWADQVARAGAGQILLTSMDRDGTRDGYDLAMTRAVADAVAVPVIASGGVGTLEHLVEGVLEGHADGVLAASIFHFGDHTIAEAKALMASRGIDVRPVGG